MEIKDNNNKILAIIVKKTEREKLENGMKIYSDPSDFIQVGYLKRGKNYKAKAHYHPRIFHGVGKTIGQEVMYVIKGRVLLKLYAVNGEKISSITLEEGDLAIIYQGHSLEFLEESLILEIKQGPYPGSEKDKIFLEAV